MAVLLQISQHSVGTRISLFLKQIALLHWIQIVIGMLMIGLLFWAYASHRKNRFVTRIEQMLNSPRFLLFELLLGLLVFLGLLWFRETRFFLGNIFSFSFQILLVFGVLSLPYLLIRFIFRKTKTHKVDPTLSPENKKDLIFLLLSILAVGTYYDFGQFHGSRTFIHIWDFFHYYMGSKYSAEIGYSNLYNCVVVAEAIDSEIIKKNIEFYNNEIQKYQKADPQKLKALYSQQQILMQQLKHLSQIETQRPYVRNLDTYYLKSAEEIKREKEQWIALFTPKRWENFRGDLWFFRGRVSPDRWSCMLRDHGYNPSPVWNTTGSLFSNLGEAKDPDHIRWLLLIDPFLLFLSAIAIYFTFGFKSAVLAFAIFGLNYPSRLFWTGGAFLRQDWLAFSIFGICCLHRKKYIFAGIFLSYASMIRVFPVLFLAGPGLKAFFIFARTRQLHKIPKRYWQLFLSFMLSCFFLLGYGCIGGAGGFQNWTTFFQKMKLHSKQNLTNNIGFKPIFLYEGELSFRDLHSERIEDPVVRSYDPFLVWEKARQKKFEARKIIFYVIFAFIFLLFSWVIPKKNDVQSSIYGILLIFFALGMTSYYYNMILLFPLFFNRANRIHQSLFATLLVSMLFLSQMLSLWLHYYFYTDFYIAIYFFISLLFGLYLTTILIKDIVQKRRRFRKKMVVVSQ